MNNNPKRIVLQQDAESITISGERLKTLLEDIESRETATRSLHHDIHQMVREIYDGNY